MRKMFKYTPLYANGKEPVIEEQDVYRIEIPYVPTLRSTEGGSGPDTTQKSTQKSTQKILDLIRENPYVTTQEMADIAASRTRQLSDAMTVPKDLMANLLLAAGGRGCISTGGGGSTSELANWDGTKKKIGWGI